MVNLKESNLLWRIESCLKEHQVDIAVGDNKVPFYLIMQENVRSPILADFDRVYPCTSDFERKLSKALLHGKSQTYGIFVDTNLKYAFAFNRKFADLNEKKDGIIFRNVHDLLLSSLPTQSHPVKILPSNLTLTPSEPFTPTDGPGSDIIMRYAIVGDKGSNNEPKKRSDVDLSKVFGRVSLLDNVRDSYIASGFKIKLNGEEKDFFLTTTSYVTNTLEDFNSTYGSSRDELKNRLAQNLFGGANVSNRYGLILDNDLRMRFAFNTKFAKYDPKLKDVVYTPEIDVLVKPNPPVEPTLNPPVIAKYGIVGQKPKPQPPKPFPSGPIFRYSIVGKKE